MTLDNNMSVFDLELSVRAYHAMINEGIETVGQLRATPDAQLLKIPNFGRRSLALLREQAPYDGYDLKRITTEITGYRRRISSLEAQLMRLKGALKEMEKMERMELERQA